jgi:hypothetical protein
LSPPDLDLIDLSYFTNLETVGDGFLYNSGVTNVVVGNTDFSNVNFINPQHAFNDGYTNNFHSKIYSGAAAASFKHKIGNNMSE